jgi:dCMP deaminase
MKQKYIDLYMDWATRVADLSHSKRLQVGAVIVKDDSVISYGYNGMPAGWDNNCEDKIWDSGAGGWLDPEEFDAKYPYEGWHDGAQRNVRYGLKTKPEVLHAERNALDKLAKGNRGGLGSTMFITHAPCLECAKSIYGAGISHVFYRDSYRSEDGIQFLTKCGVSIEKLSSEDNKSATC